MINGFVQLERGVRDGEFETLKKLAERDGHGVFLPSLTIRKHDKLAGWLSINSVPFVLAHFDKVALSPRDSFTIVNSVENHVGLNGAQGIVWPLPVESPFYPLMDHLGYKNFGKYELFYKKV